MAEGASTEEITRKYKRLESNKNDWQAETQKELKRQQYVTIYPYVL